MQRIVEKRKHPRARPQGYIADIGDSGFVYAGTVSDVSAEGLRLRKLSERFTPENKKYHVIVSGGPDSVAYRLTVSPCWKRKNGTSVEVGFNIFNAPSRWKAFVQNMILEEILEGFPKPARTRGAVRELQGTQRKKGRINRIRSLTEHRVYCTLRSGLPA